MAWHGDRMGRLVDDTVVAILSVGAPRRFLLRPAAGGASRAFDLGWGDLLVMGGSCQRTWQHAVPKTALAGPRISIQFRPDTGDAASCAHAPVNRGGRFARNASSPSRASAVAISSHTASASRASPSSSGRP